MSRTTASPATEANPRPQLIFATGQTAGIAAILESSAGTPSVLTSALARSLQSELSELAIAAARQAAPQARALSELAAALGERHDRYTAQTLTTLLVFDGLTSPVIRRLIFGDAPPASVIAVETGGSADPASAAAGGMAVPFLRACVRPGNHEVAAAFCCGERFPTAADLHLIFSDPSVRRAISSVGGDGSIIIDVPARRLLDRVAAADHRVAYGEYSDRSALPIATANQLATIRKPAFALAESLLHTTGTPAQLADSLRAIGEHTLPQFGAQDALEATLGVFYHSIAGEWYRQGIWADPPEFRLHGGDGPVRSLILVDISG